MPTNRSYGPAQQVADALTVRQPLAPQPYGGPQYAGPSVAVRPDLAQLHTGVPGGGLSDKARPAYALRGETVSGGLPIGQGEVHGQVSLDPRLHVQDAGIGGSAPVGPGRLGIDVDMLKRLSASYGVPIGKGFANVTGSVSPQDVGVRAGVRVPFKL